MWDMIFSKVIIFSEKDQCRFDKGYWTMKVK